MLHDIFAVKNRPNQIGGAIFRFRQIRFWGNYQFAPAPQL